MAMMADKLSRLSAREKTGLVLALLMGLAVVANFAVIRPVRRGFDGMNADIARERNRIEASLKILAPSRVKAIDAEYQQYGRLIGMRTSPAEENAKMLGEIEGLASQASVVLNGTKPREPKAREYYEEYPVEIEVEGEWAGIAGFLYGLQHSPQLLKVQDLTLSPKARETPSVVKGAILVTKVVGL